MWGSTTASVAAAATAASAAVPPALRVSIATWVASGWEVAAIPLQANTAERPGLWKSRSILGCNLTNRNKDQDTVMEAPGHPDRNTFLGMAWHPDNGGFFVSGRNMRPVRSGRDRNPYDASQSASRRPPYHSAARAAAAGLVQENVATGRRGPDADSETTRDVDETDDQQQEKRARHDRPDGHDQNQ